MDQEYILEMKHVSKAFSGVKALDDCTLRVKRGAVHALLGENGAGKSTLMKILLGIYKADKGDIVFDGRVLKHSSVNESLELGISMIHQELSFIPNMTVAENIYVGREPGFLGLVDERSLHKNVTELLQRLDIEINPKAKMRSLTTAYKQLVEIVKAISYHAKLIIMDEPTSALSEKEQEKLFRIIRQLTLEGVTIIYISHKLSEIFEVCDSVTVLRDGCVIDTRRTSDFDESSLINMMVGREMTQMYPSYHPVIGDVVMSVKNFSKIGQFHNVTFDVHRGEILGFSGLMGAGRSELMDCIFGMRRPDNGEVYIHGKKVVIKDAFQAIQHGIGYLTEDRKGSGIFPTRSVSDNMVMPNLDEFIKAKTVSEKKVSGRCLEQVKRFSIKTHSLHQTIRDLSGGNQQKVLFARWMMMEPEILIIDEPTRGIDVGAKYEIHKFIADLAGMGKAVIMVSSEMPEILGMSTRIITMHEGRITGELPRDEATQEKLMMLATA